jgi:hypothetical protein
MKRLLLTLCAASWLVAAHVAASPPGAVLVKGSPPLTQQTVDQVGAFWEWMFAAPLTSGQQEGLRQELVAIWEKGNRTEIQGTAGVIGQHRELAKMPVADLEVRRQQLLPQVVQLLERSESEGISRWALALYRSSHQPLAAGTPPLTRQASDAYLEVLCFMGNQTTGQAFVPDQRLKDSWASTLAAGYGQLGPEHQALISRMPPLRAALVASWPKLSAGERAQFQQQWARQLGIQPGVAGTKAPAGVATAPPETSSGSAAALVADHQSRQATYQGFSNMIMGSHYSTMNTMFSNFDKPYRYVPK